ncbi:MAG TPA: hypothetical protein VKV23_04040 [Acidimicrobiales bacterium]|nr:hypothetical protein [Acidimicrobiales bacterium]
MGAAPEDPCPEPSFAELGRRLADALDATLAGFVEGCVLARLAEAGRPVDEAARDRARRAGRAAAEAVLPRLHELLAADAASQATTPLALVRRAIPFATAALADLEVEPVPRDPFRRARFPEDHYDLVPGSMAALGAEVGELAIAWGAAKARVHRCRQAGSDPHPPSGGRAKPGSNGTTSSGRPSQ